MKSLAILAAVASSIVDAQSINGNLEKSIIVFVQTQFNDWLKIIAQISHHFSERDSDPPWFFRLKNPQISLLVIVVYSRRRVDRMDRMRQMVWRGHPGSSNDIDGRQCGKMGKSKV